MPVRPLIHADESYGYVWDPIGLVWEPAQQAGTGGGGGAVTNVGTFAVQVTSAIPGTAVTAASGSVSSSGNNTLLTPGAGKKLRLYYGAYNPSAAVEVAFRFGAAGALFLRNNLTVGGSVIAKNYGDLLYVEGAVNESLYLNLTGAVATIWNANYLEI